MKTVVETDVPLSSGFTVYVKAEVSFGASREPGVHLVNCITTYDGYNSAPYFPNEEELRQIKREVISQAFDGDVEVL